MSKRKICRKHPCGILTSSLFSAVFYLFFDAALEFVDTRVVLCLVLLLSGFCFYLLFDEKILFLLRNIAAAFAFSLLFFCIDCELDLQGKVFPALTWDPEQFDSPYFLGTFALIGQQFIEILCGIVYYLCRFIKSKIKKDVR